MNSIPFPVSVREKLGSAAGDGLAHYYNIHQALLHLHERINSQTRWIIGMATFIAVLFNLIDLFMDKV